MKSFTVTLPATITKAVNAVTAVAVVVVPVLVDNNVLSARWGAVVGGLVAAFAGGHHTLYVANAVAARKTTTQQVTP